MIDVPPLSLAEALTACVVMALLFGPLGYRWALWMLSDNP